MCAGSRAGEGRNPTRNLPRSCSSLVWWLEQLPVPNLRAAPLSAGMNLLGVLGVSSSQTSCSWTLSRKTTAKGKIRGEVRDMQCWAMNSRNFSAAMCEVMPQQSCTSCSSSLSSWTLSPSPCALILVWHWSLGSGSCSHAVIFSLLFRNSLQSNGRSRAHQEHLRRDKN